MTERKAFERIAFSKRTIEGLKTPAEGRAWIYDKRTQGLAVCVSSTGGKVLYYNGRFDGRAQRIRLGRFPGMSVEQATNASKRLIGRVAAGENVQARKRSGRLALRDVFAAYLGHAQAHNRPKSNEEAERIYTKYLAGWHLRALRTITSEDATELHLRLGKDHGKPQANRVIALGRTLFNHAAKHMTYTGANPCVSVQRFREKARERFMDANELRRFFKSLSDEPDALWRDLFTVALLTGARKSNILAMRFAELRLQEGLWIVPDAKSKTGDAMVIHLPTKAIEILKRRQQAASGEWVFPGSGRTGHIAEPKAVWARIIARAKITDLTIHDLRRTHGSWQAMSGASLPVIGKSLGHRTAAATAIYARLDLSPVARSVEIAANRMLEAGNGDSTDED